MSEINPQRRSGEIVGRRCHAQRKEAAETSGQATRTGSTDYERRDCPRFEEGLREESGSGQEGSEEGGQEVGPLAFSNWPPFAFSEKAFQQVT